MERDTLSTAELQEFIPEVWANRAIGLFQKELGVARFVAKDSDFTAVKQGSILHIPKRGSLEANQKLPHQPVTLQQPESDTVPVTVDQHWEVTFSIEDVAEAQTNQDVMDGYIQDAIQVLGEKVESALVALTPEFDDYNDPITGGVDGPALLSARAALTRQGAPRRDRHLFLNPGDVNLAMELEKFIDAGITDIENGDLGRIYGFNSHESLFLEGIGSPAEDYSFAMHRNALVLATRALPEPKGGAKVAVVEKDGIIMRVVYSYNADYLAEQVTVDMLYGVGVLQPELGVRITE